MKKVFVLQWNPVISDTSEDYFAKIVESGKTRIGWEIYDWKEAEIGDLVYMVKCRPAPDAGIVMQGHIIGKPFSGPHWSGQKGRRAHYVYMSADYLINHDECPILSLESLEAAMPDFQWDGGHSGRKLPVKESIILEGMWLEYLDSHKEYFDGMRARSKKQMK